eukprot:12907596-Alexandrium_andersonii.AAC.1
MGERKRHLRRAGPPLRRSASSHRSARRAPGACVCRRACILRTSRLILERPTHLANAVDIEQVFVGRLIRSGCVFILPNFPQLGTLA